MLRANLQAIEITRYFTSGDWAASQAGRPFKHQCKRFGRGRRLASVIHHAAQPISAVSITSVGLASRAASAGPKGGHYPEESFRTDDNCRLPIRRRTPARLPTTGIRPRACGEDLRIGSKLHSTGPEYPSGQFSHPEAQLRRRCVARSGWHSVLSNFSAAFALLKREYFFRWSEDASCEVEPALSVQDVSVEFCADGVLWHPRRKVSFD